MINQRKPRALTWLFTWLSPMFRNESISNLRHVGIPKRPWWLDPNVGIKVSWPSRYRHLSATCLLVRYYMAFLIALDTLQRLESSFFSGRYIPWSKIKNRCFLSPKFKSQIKFAGFSIIIILLAKKSKKWYQSSIIKETHETIPYWFVYSTSVCICTGSQNEQTQYWTRVVGSVFRDCIKSKKIPYFEAAPIHQSPPNFFRCLLRGSRKPAAKWSRCSCSAPAHSPPGERKNTTTVGKETANIGVYDICLIMYCIHIHTYTYTYSYTYRYIYILIHIHIDMHTYIYWQIRHCG